LKVLIADDELHIRETMKIILEARGNEVITAQDGEDCMNVYSCHSSSADQKAIGTPFDVVVLDYRMPKKSGLEVAEEMLKLNPRQRIIFASAYTTGTIEDLSISLKGHKNVQYLQKPFDLELFSQIVEDSSPAMTIPRPANRLF